ncbi:MAG: translocation/assembly module TamB domain-containing protein [Deltaproteobacteria bacterium]|nr:translocation/assembly module TamB domain-containing protein [Deltaproteobacteria bacterium]
MRRWLLVIGLSVLLLLGVTFVVLRVKFEGEDLGRNVASILNKTMRGRIEIGSIEWQTKDLKKVAAGGWIPVVIKDVRVWDDCALSQVLGDTEEVRLGDPREDCTPDERPDTDPQSRRKPRKQLLRTPLITAELDAHALLFGNHDFVFRNVWIHGGQALIEETREPYPLHAYDKTAFTIITAFYPRMAAGFRAGIYADSPPPVFDLRDIHVKNLELFVNVQPYQPEDVPADHIGFGMSARLEHVNIDSDDDPAKRTNDSYLYMDATDPLVAKFYVRLGVTSPKARLRILDEGPRTAFRMPYPKLEPVAAAGPPEVPKERTSKYDLGLADIKLNRLAQLPTEWPRHDFVANTLELDLQARTAPCALAPGEPEDGLLVPRYEFADAEAGSIRITGELNSYFDRPYDGSWNLKLDAKNLGPTIRSCINSSIGGDDLHGTISLTGPFVASPRVGLELKNLDFDIALRADEEPLRLTLAEVHGGIDLVNEQGFIDKTKALIRGGKEPGEVEVSATFGLRPYIANAAIEITKAIDAGRFLPPKVARAAGKFLKGRLRAKGDTTPGEGFALEEFDLSLGHSPTSTSLRVHKGRLFTSDKFGSIHVEKVAVEAGQSHAVFDGLVDLLNENIRMRIEGTFPDLGVWLQRFDLPNFVGGAGGGSVIIINGKLRNPTVTVNTELTGVPCLDRLRLIDTQYQDGVVEIRKLTSQGLGGELTGSGRVRVDGANPFVERLTLSGRRIEAGRLCGLAGKVKGTLDVLDAQLDRVTVVKGRDPMDWLDYATVYATAKKLSIKGDAYSDVALCVNRPDDAQCRPRPLYANKDDLDKCALAKKSGGTCIVMSALRDQGGVLDATVAKLPAVRGNTRVAAVPARLGGAVSVDLPLAILEQFMKKRILGGNARMTLHLAGTPDAPQAEGHLTLLRTWLMDAFIGDSQLRVEPKTLANGKPGIRIHGSMLSDRLQIDGTLGTTAPFPVELKVTGRRIELDAVMDLSKLLKISEPVQAWVTGSITVKTELFPVKPVEPEAWIELSELTAIVNHRAADGRLTPLRLSVIDQAPGARPAVSLRLTPSSLELTCRDAEATGGRLPCTTKLATPAGIVELRGHATQSSVAIEVAGTLDLGLVQPLLDSRFDEASGQVRLSAAISGTFDAPRFEAAIDLDPDGLWHKDRKAATPIRLRPVGGDTVLEAPTGLIKLANGSLGFTDVILRVRDQHKDEEGELHVKGNISLDGLTPANWSVLISGKLAGKMLLVAVPDKVSQAGGLATIEGDLILSGRGLLPLISGSISFKPEGKARPLSLIPRGVRRELSFTEGGVDIETTAIGNNRTYEIAINDVRGSIDGEGSVSNINGTIELRDSELMSLSVRLDADNIPFKVAGTLDAIVTARDVQITKPTGSQLLDIRGNVSIIDGTYKNNFELTDQIRSIGSGAAPAKPFWDEYPLLGNADLHLTLDVRKFSVRNNIATIDLVGPLIEITNTPKDPRMSGSIRVESGEFRIPGTRARFTRSAGSIDFAENQKASDPQLNVTSEADYRDLSGQEHGILLSITGALSNPQWDLKTTTGYNKSQTLSLLVLGRNQESLRRSLGDQSLGSDPTKTDPTTNPSQGFADQIVKDLAGDWVAGVLGNSLTSLSGLDVLRIEISFGSIGLRLEKKIVENLKAVGDAEQTIRGSTLNVRGELKTPLKVSPSDAGLSLQGGYLRKNFYDPAEEDIDEGSLKLVYRHIFIP